MTTKLDRESIRKINIELANRDFWHYCKLRIPTVYREDRPWLKDMCTRMQDFIQNSEKRFMVVNIPPRHFKSLTGKLVTEWCLGNNPSIGFMTGSYNETLASIFSKGVRNAIQTAPGINKNKYVFQDIFPGVTISKNDAAAGMWSLQDNPVPNYLATSPGGTATGVGCQIMLIDDILRNAIEAYSTTVLESNADWFFNTMMSRLEGNWKVIIVMQRWAEDDLAGKVLRAYDCEHVIYPAYTEVDGKRVFLDENILDEKSYAAKTHRMNPDIANAIYLQKPTNAAGRLYKDFNEYNPREFTLKSDEMVYCVTDTADRGTDSLVALTYVLRNDVAYILEPLFTRDPMEITERLAADLHDKWGVSVSWTEANNGGRLYAQNVRRNMTSKKCIFEDGVTTANKEARILQSSGWVQRNVVFPAGWKHVYPELYMEIMSYDARGKNEHDDAVDCLAMLYERATLSTNISQESYSGQQATYFSQFYEDDENEKVQYEYESWW